MICYFIYSWFSKKFILQNFPANFVAKLLLRRPKRKKKKRRCRCDRAGMPGANAPQRTATKIRLPEMAALSIYGSPSERIPISGP